MRLDRLVNLVERYPETFMFAACALFVIAFAALFFMALRIRALSRRVKRIETGRDLLRAVEKIDPKNLALNLDRIESKVSSSLRHVGMVRFNAFDDVGSSLSFALAVLDDRGDGFVISSLFGRNETRTYAKPVSRGTSEYPLSAEEEEAIRKAMRQ